MYLVGDNWSRDGLYDNTKFSYRPNIVINKGGAFVYQELLLHILIWWTGVDGLLLCARLNLPRPGISAYHKQLIWTMCPHWGLSALFSI